MEYKLIRDLYSIGAIKIGEFVLKSGLPSKIYFDLRSIISYPTILKQVSEIIWEKIKLYPFDFICGVAYTGIPIATCIAIEQHCPMLMLRKEKKNYGTKQHIEGAYQTNQTCIVIDDVITTGTSIIETSHQLVASGLVVTDAIALVDRSTSKIHTEINLHSVFTLNEILNFLSESDFVTELEREVINEYTTTV